MKRPEDALQRTVCALFDQALPDDAVYFAIPNGGGRSKVEAAIFKATGVKAGIPDLCVIWKERAFFIELKAKGKYLSSAQRDMHTRLAAAKCAVRTCRSVDEVSEFMTMVMADDWRATVT